jgi:hypothetical protein
VGRTLTAVEADEEKEQTQCGPGSGQGSDRRGVEADTLEEWVHGVDQPAVGEVVDVTSRFPWRRNGRAASTWRRSVRRRRGPDGGGGRHGGGASARVAGEMIIAWVRVSGGAHT